MMSFTIDFQFNFEVPANYLCEIDFHTLALRIYLNWDKNYENRLKQIGSKLYRIVKDLSSKRIYLKRIQSFLNSLNAFHSPQITDYH